jgi:rhamnosyltransferase
LSNYPYQIWGDKYLKMITVDILLPTYNGERYIKEQITSLLEQTHLNIRIYIRDDRSTDGTVSIMKIYQAKIQES